MLSLPFIPSCPATAAIAANSLRANGNFVVERSVREAPKDSISSFVMPVVLRTSAKASSNPINAFVDA